MIELSPEFKDIAAALLRFQADVHGVRRDSKNPAFRSRYASLEAVVETVRPGLQAAGIMFTQAAGAIVDGKLSLTTMLIHAESGQWLKSTMQTALPKSDPQAVGSACTYLCRYSLMGILGVPPTDDDDGEAAMPDRRQEPAKPAQQPQREKPQPLPQDKQSAEASGMVLTWVAEVERCASRADLNFLFRSEEWARAKAIMSDKEQKIVQDALARHPEYQGRAAA